VDIPPLRKLTTTAAGQAIWVVEGDQSGTLERWRMVRGAHQHTGLWPFLLTANADMLPDLVHFAANEADLAELSRGEALHSDEVLREMAAMAASDDVDDDGGGERDESTYDQEASAVTPDVLADIEGWLQRDQPRRLALIEAAQGWEVPVRLAWSGSVNYDLSGGQHLSVLRRWAQRYGAELLTLGFDTIELLVERPPTGKDEALAVAREQFAYCPDIVWQGVGTIGSLAATQVRSHLWYFWWD
jgi:hypothetical protein